MVFDSLQRPAQAAAAIKSDILFVNVAIDSLRRGAPAITPAVIRQRAIQARDNLNKLIEDLPQ